MTTFNRTAILVKPSQSFLDWLHQADPTSKHLTLEDLRREPMVYLLPKCENEKRSASTSNACPARFSRSHSTAETVCLRRRLRDATWKPSIGGSSGVFTRWWSISATTRYFKKRSNPLGFMLRSWLAVL
jgi:hypothetical protein